jgi:hypothetical protein
MLDGIRSLGLDTLPWDDDARDFLARCEFVRKLGRKDLDGWPDVSKESLAQDLAWLEPFLDGVTRRSQLSRVPLMDALRARLSYEQQRKLDELRADARPPAHGIERAYRSAYRHLDDERAQIASMRMARGVRPGKLQPRIGGGNGAKVNLHRCSRLTGTTCRKPCRSLAILRASGAMPTSRCARTCAGDIRATTGRRIRWKPSPRGRVKPRGT